MTRDEALSRLLAGELSPAETAHWHEQIRTDPAVASAWRALKQLSEDLAALPVMAPPEALVQAAAGSREPSRRWAQLPWRGLAVAAALLAMVVWASRPMPRPTLELVRGAQQVVGDARLIAGGVPVRIDGDVKVRVEPGTVGPQVTVTVAEGTAWVGASSDALVEVRAGQTHTTQGPPGNGPAREAPPTVVPVVVDGADPQARIEALELAIEQLSFERDALRGQLSVASGEPLAWPSDLAPELGPVEFAATLRAILGPSDVEVTDVDCSEYPCVAVLDLGRTDDPMVATQGLTGVLREGAEAVLGTDALGMGLQVEAHDDEEGGMAWLLVGVSLGNEDVDPREPRVTTRVTELLERWRPDAGSDP